MKPLLLIALFAGSTLFSGCETGDHRRAYHRRVYIGTTNRERVVYRHGDPYYSPRYRSDRVIYVAPGQTNRDYPARSLDRSYAF